jgi:hypothetical protein
MNKIKFPPILIVVFSLLIGWALISINPVLSLISLVVVPLLIKMFWDKNIPPVLIIGILFQWLSITIKVFYANIFGFDFTDQFLHKYPENIETSFYLNIIGFMALALGIFLSADKKTVYKKEDFIAAIREYDSKRVLTFYLVFSLVLYFFLNYAWLLPGITQLLFQFNSFKWGILFFAFSVCYLKKERMFLLSLIIIVEIIFGFATYFSYFKEFIIFLGIFYLYYHPIEQLNLKRFSFAAVLVSVLIVFSALWSLVKQDYRDFLSGGVKEQVVTVSQTEALNELLNISQNLNFEFADIGVLMVIERFSYIDYFSAVVSNVPSNIPHTNGDLFLGAFLHIITPRLLFPDKPALDDSDHLSKYSGMNVAGVREGTSIGLGFKGDAYIDFGYFLFIPLFVLGFIIGKVYHLILRRSYNIIWGFAFITPVFYVVNNSETSMVKTVGGIFTYLIMWFIVNKFFVRKVDGWVKG